MPQNRRSNKAKCKMYITYHGEAEEEEAAKEEEKDWEREHKDVEEQGRSKLPESLLDILLRINQKILAH